jgi:hypothetical protein
MDMEDLLRRAGAAPLGPLALTFATAGPDAWTLTVTLGNRTRTIRAERDSATEGLILACRSESRDIQGGPWVTDTTETLGVSERRLWLHGDGLTPALLLNALAELMHLAAPEPGGPEAAEEMSPIIALVKPPEESRPEPLPVSRPRVIPWQSFEAPARPAETPAAESPVPEGASESPAGAATPPEPTLEPVVMPSAQHPDPPATPEPLLEPVVLPGSQSSSPTAQPESELPLTSQITPIPTDATPPVGTAGHCHECGSPYTADHSFCTNCGARLN